MRINKRKDSSQIIYLIYTTAKLTCLVFEGKGGLGLTDSLPGSHKTTENVQDPAFNEKSEKTKTRVTRK